MTINQKMLINAAQKMKLSIKDFFNKYEQTMQFPLDLVTFAEEILDCKLHFLCSITFITVLPLSFTKTLLYSSQQVKNHQDYPYLLKRC